MSPLWHYLHHDFDSPFFMEQLENNFGVKYSVSVHRVFEVATAFSFTAGHLCMFRLFWTYTDDLPRAGTAEGSRLPWSAFPRVLNFWRVQLLFYVAVLINSGACRVMAPIVISSEHSSCYFKVASILSLVPFLMFMNRYDRKMA